MNRLRLRREYPTDDLVVVRGGLLDETRLRADATLTFRRFGEYGVSVLAAPGDAMLDSLARTTLRREATLALLRVGDIRRAGLEVRPTFRRPHYTVMLPDLDTDLRRLVACENTVQVNPHYIPTESQR